MATTETRPSFRLPWTAGTGESESSPSPEEEPIATASPDDPEENQTPEMIDTAPEPQASARSAPGAVAPRRATKFMADLTRAMQAAAEQSRNETMTRFEGEARAFTEEIRAGITAVVADLRRKADDDMAAIREKSKADIAQIRERTEARVAARKSGLEAEMEAQAATVEARAERVAEVVAFFEAEMAEFFERLNAEEDPTRIATMAETMPDAPNLEDEVASVMPSPVAGVPESDAKRTADTTRETMPLAEAEIDFAAAEAEAASFDGDLRELGDDDEILAPAAANAEAIVEVPDEPVAAVEPTPAAAPEAASSTRLVVTGLVSVASIANFKRSLARIGGVLSIGVASGPHGEFVFTVSHDEGLPLSTAIVSMMPSFESQVTGTSGGEIQLIAKERDEPS